MIFFQSQLWPSMRWTALCYIALSFLVIYSFLQKKYKIAFNLLALTLSLLFIYSSPVTTLSLAHSDSFHMIQSLWLLLIVPLILVNTTEILFTLGHLSWIEEAYQFLAKTLYQKPYISWLLFQVVMIFWHLPSIQQEPIAGESIIHPLSLIIAGFLFWLPIFSHHYSYQGLNAVFYLFTTCIGCTTLAVYITFTPAPTMDHIPHFLPAQLALKQMGLTPTIDRFLAGLLMWLPPCLLYVVIALYKMHRWLNSDNNPSIAPINKREEITNV